MYRVAICEDEPVMREEMRTLCEAILTERGIEHELSVFPSAGALDEMVGSDVTPYDLLMLDILMDEGMTGMELARTLRRRDDLVSIIFITSSKSYLLEGYGVQPIQFLLKPVSREGLEQAILTDWRRHHMPRFVLLRSGGKDVPLPLAEILYVESRDHNSIVHLKSGEQAFRLSLSEVEQVLPSGQFVRCHNSFLINLAHVKLVGRTELILRDGARLPVGRRYYQPFQTAFVQYINR